MNILSLVALLVSSVLMVSVSGHGYIVGPFTGRNSVITHDCPHCANGRGVCGDGNQWHADSTVVDVISKYTTTMNRLEANQIIEIGVRVTAAHWGHFVMELCRPTGNKITEECFTTRLQRDPSDTRYSPFIPSDPTVAIFQNDACVTNSVQKVRFIVPNNFSNCEHCILRWAWQTGNSCRSHPAISSSSASQEIRDWRSVDGCKVDLSSSLTCGEKCPNPSCPNEQFKNCIDVSIESSGGPTLPPKPTSTKSATSTKVISTKLTSTKSTIKYTGDNKCCVNPTYENVPNMLEWCRINGCSPPTHCIKC